VTNESENEKVKGKWLGDDWQDDHDTQDLSSRESLAVLKNKALK
jgi:hypothetical protein